MFVHIQNNMGLIFVGNKIQSEQHRAGIQGAINQQFST